MHLLKDENGNVIPHGHHDHHEHHHDHDHSHEHHDHHAHHEESAAGSAQEGDRSKALLAYMLAHNESHAAELDKMAQLLTGEGREAAAEHVRKAVDEFMKGNMYLRLALSDIEDSSVKK